VYDDENVSIKQIGNMVTRESTKDSHDQNSEAIKLAICSLVATNMPEYVPSKPPACTKCLVSLLASSSKKAIALDGPVSWKSNE
jgi:hypothetical protein